MAKNKSRLYLGSFNNKKDIFHFILNSYCDESFGGLITAAKIAVKIVNNTAMIIGFTTFKLSPPTRLLSTKLTIALIIMPKRMLRGVSCHSTSTLIIYILF